MLDNTPNQPIKFRAKNWLEVNDELQGTYNKDNQSRFKTLILSSILCDYGDTYTIVKGTVTVAQATAVALNNANKKVLLKNRATLTSCISRINNTQVDDTLYVDVVLPMYNLREYGDNYSKTSGTLWQYCRDEPAVNDDGEIIDFTADNAIPVKIKERNNS